MACKGLIHQAKWCIYASVNKAITGSDNDLRQAIMWNNTELFLYGTFETNFGETGNKIQQFSY